MRLFRTPSARAWRWCRDREGCNGLTRRLPKRVRLNAGFDSCQMRNGLGYNIKNYRHFFTAIGGLYHWRNIRFRSQLKDDLEILKLYGAYGADNPNYQALKSHVDRTISKAYPVKDAPTKLGRHDWVNVILGVINFLFIPVYIAVMISSGFTWVFVVLILFNGSIGIIVTSDVWRKWIR